MRKGTDIQRGKRLGIPSPSDCFCSTESLMRRYPDPRGYGRRVPAGSLPEVPRAHQTEYVCEAGNSYITFQCSDILLLPPPVASRLSPQPTGASVARDARALDILVATYDHFGHGLFAIVQRVINQVEAPQLLYPPTFPLPTALYSSCSPRTA